MSNNFRPVVKLITDKNKSNSLDNELVIRNNSDIIFKRSNGDYVSNANLLSFYDRASEKLSVKVDDVQNSNVQFFGLEFTESYSADGSITLNIVDGIMIPQNSKFMIYVDLLDVKDMTKDEITIEAISGEIIDYNNLSETVFTTSVETAINSIIVRNSSFISVSKVLIGVQVEAQPIPVSNVKITNTDEEIYSSSNFQMNWRVFPRDASDKNVTFSTSDPSIATIDNTGLISTGVKEGSVNIEVLTDDRGFKDSKAFTVKTAYTFTGTHVNDSIIDEFFTTEDEARSYLLNIDKTSIKTLKVTGKYTGSVTIGDKYYDTIFGNMSSLISLDLSGFDTSGITDMTNLFSLCTTITSLDLSNFDTSSVTDMTYMFYNCYDLTSLDISTFDTSSVTSMGSMFYNCSSLTSLDLSNFDTSSVTDMTYMFYGCTTITSLDLSNFDTSSVTDMTYMFYTCFDLTSLDISTFDTSSVINMKGLFYYCSSLTSLDLSNFDTSNATDISGLFFNCTNLMSVNLSSFNTSRVTSISSLFRGCDAITILDLSSFDTSSITSMNYTFVDCYNVKSSYARTQADADKLNSSPNKPGNVNFIVKL